MADTQPVDASALIAKFKDLRDEVQIKIGRRMLAAGGRVLKEQARANVRALGLVRTGTLENNIVTKHDPRPQAGSLQLSVGVRHGRYLSGKKKADKRISVTGAGRIRIKNPNDPFYWRFLELTTAKRTGTPFITPALVEKQADVLAAMERVLDRALKAQAKGKL